MWRYIQMKAGIKTTEFWMTIVTIVASAAATLQDILDPKYAAIAAAISSVGYSISRSLVKKND